MPQLGEVLVQSGFRKDDGSIVPGMCSDGGILRTVPGQSPFYDLVKNGRVFAVANQTGVTTQAGLSATTPALTLYNPAGSGVNAALLYAGCTLLVANAAAAAIWLAANTNVVASAVTGTPTTAHRNLLLGGGAPAIVPMTAATLPAAPVGIDLLGSGLTGAITTLPGQTMYEKWYNGLIVLQPGTAISIQTSTASGATSMFCSYIWEEVPILS